MRLTAPLAALALSLALLAGCGHRGEGDGNADSTGARDEALPAPQAGAGSVTGMPDTRGPGSPAVAGAEAQLVLEPGLDQAPDPLANPETGILPGASDGPSSAGDAVPVAEDAEQQDAVAVIRDYYASINAQSHARAHALWADGGRRSGQSPQQFAAGFAATAGISVQLASPGAIRAEGEWRTITIPVAVTATRRDGSVRRYDGNYTLRRSVAPGAGAEERAWRISEADLRELQ